MSNFYVPISLVPFRLGRGGKNENVPMQCHLLGNFFWKASLRGFHSPSAQTLKSLSLLMLHFPAQKLPTVGAPV